VHRWTRSRVEHRQARSFQKVIFVSKEQSLRVMREKHPEEVAALPTNPFPNVLKVIPKRPEDVKRIAGLFRAEPARGVFAVDYGR